MKATRYFSDYQSAYNYYGGNVVPSTEIALIGDGSYIFVSSDNAVSGNQQYFDVSMTNDEIVDTMTYTAYNNGVSYGEAVGFETGYTAGTTYGEAIGYAQGYEGGYSYGYDIGYDEGNVNGYNDGFNVGYAEASGGGGDELPDEQKDMVAYGTLANTLLISNVPAPVYKIGPDEIAAEQMLYCIEEFGNQFMSTVWFDKWTADNGFESDPTSEIDTDNSSYIYWQGSLAEGDKVGFSLVPAADDGMGDNALDSYCNFIVNTISDPESGDSTLTHWYTAPFDADWKLLIEIGSDPETGDHTVEITFEEVP